MLLAEIHGKRCHEARAMEDYLTSAVFGHLRFVQSRSFWQSLFERALSIDCISLADQLATHAIDLAVLANVSVRFWPSLGPDQPDIVLHFSKEAGYEFVVVVEAKLWSGKSDFGEKDQLLRYLGSADKIPAGIEPFRPLIYLTAQSGLEDVRDSIDQPVSKVLHARQRIFLLEWQDIQEVANAMRGNTLYLSETADFLEAVGQMRFRRFRAPVSALKGTFYRAEYFIDLEKSGGGRFYAN